MSKSYLKKWGRAAGMRALKTGAEVALAGIGTTALITEVHWAAVASMVALSMVTSLLVSIKVLPEVDGGGSPAAKDGE